MPPNYNSGRMMLTSVGRHIYGTMPYHVCLQNHIYIYIYILYIYILLHPNRVLPLTVWQDFKRLEWCSRSVSVLISNHQPSLIILTKSHHSKTLGVFTQYHRRETQTSHSRLLHRCRATPKACRCPLQGVISYASKATVFRRYTHAGQ